MGLPEELLEELELELEELDEELLEVPELLLELLDELEELDELLSDGPWPPQADKTTPHTAATSNLLCLWGI